MNSIRSHSRTILAIPILATLTLAGSTLVLPSGALAASDGSDASSTHKVFVCKYVGTPGVDERLKAGKNPISVDLHTIDEYRDFQGDIDTLVGGHFADAQGRSFVLVVDRGQAEPPVSDCPGYEPGETPTPSPVETPTASPVETPVPTPTASPVETPTETPVETEPDATPTPNLAVIPTPAPSATVDAAAGEPQVTPPATDTVSSMRADHDGNVVPVLLLLAGLTAVFALATPSARGARRPR